MNTSLPRTRAMVLDTWKVLYVVTPKVMCTSMLWLMAELQGEELGASVRASRAAEVTRATAVHDPAVWTNTPPLHTLPGDDVERILSDDSWLRIALVRHPVDRLWSAWQSKLLLREPAYQARFGSAPWFPRIPRRRSNAEGCVDVVVEDFASFVRTLADDSELLVADQHWAPQSFLLRPGEFPYTEIGRAEAFTAILGRLELHLRAQGWTGALEFPSCNATLLPRNVIRDAGLLRLIEDIYAGDMAAFGYRPAKVGRRAGMQTANVAVQAVSDLVERHERIGDLYRLLPRARQPQRVAVSPRKSVSIIALCENSWDARDCLPDNAEIVVAPSASSPAGPGVTARLQAGLEATSGDVVVFCRSSAPLLQGWVDRMSEALDDSDVGLVGMAPVTIRVPGLPVLSSTCIAARRNTLTRLGGWDTGMRGGAWHDVELCLRAWRCGLKSVALMDATDVQEPDAAAAAGQFLHDYLRLAMTHMNRERFAELLESLRGAADLLPALAAVLTSDVGSRRSRIEQIAVRDADLLLHTVVTERIDQGGLAS